jgi:hypothetical protein
MHRKRREVGQALRLALEQRVDVFLSRFSGSVPGKGLFQRILQRGCIPVIQFICCAAQEKSAYNAETYNAKFICKAILNIRKQTKQIENWVLKYVHKNKRCLVGYGGCMLSNVNFQQRTHKRSMRRTAPWPAKEATTPVYPRCSQSQGGRPPAAELCHLHRLFAIFLPSTVSRSISPKGYTRVCQRAIWDKLTSTNKTFLSPFVPFQHLALTKSSETKKQQNNLPNELLE